MDQRTMGVYKVDVKMIDDNLFQGSLPAFLNYCAEGKTVLLCLIELRLRLERFLNAKIFDNPEYGLPESYKISDNETGYFFAVEINESNQVKVFMLNNDHLAVFSRLRQTVEIFQNMVSNFITRLNDTAKQIFETLKTSKPDYPSLHKITPGTNSTFHYCSHYSIECDPVDFSVDEIQEKAFILPISFCMRYKVFPIQIVEGTLIVAISNQLKIDYMFKALEEIYHSYGRYVQAHLTPEEEILEQLAMVSIEQGPNDKFIFDPPIDEKGHLCPEDTFIPPDHIPEDEMPKD